MQVRKARASLSHGLWIVSHPHSMHSIVTEYPHDQARRLIEQFVLGNQLWRGQGNPLLPASIRN